MRLLIVSATGYGLGLASHLSSEGHAVSMILTHEDCVGSVGRGIVSEDNHDLPDITVFDHSRFGINADQLRRNGARVFGTSHWAQMLEEDDDYQKAVIRACGWDTTPLPAGITIYVSAWFNGNDYLSSYVSMVYHRVHPGGQSPDVGFVGALSNFWQPTAKVREAILDPLLKVLRRVNHRGCFHLRCNVDSDKFSVIDVSASFEHPLSLLLFENSKASTPDILLRLFNEDSKPIIPLDQWACSVMLSVPPYPYTVHHPPTPLEGLVPGNLKHLWLVDAMRDNGKWMTTGSHGKVGYVTSRGASTVEATRRAYRTIRNLQVQDLQYRPDVGKGLNQFLSSLKNYGWLK